MPVLSIDQGTTGTTAAWIDNEGRCQNWSNVELTQHYPQPGWVEHNPEEIWKSVETAVVRLFEKGFCRFDIDAVSITNQRETTVLWERKTGKPVHNAVVWQCKRTGSFCSELVNRGYEKRVRETTGLLLDSYFSASKIAWLLENVEGLRRRAEAEEIAFGTIDTWLLWNLTGKREHLTDYTNASRTMLLDIDRREWSEEMLDIFGIPHSLLPGLRDSSFEFGKTRDVGFLPDGIPVAGIAGDQQAALFGQGCVEKGTLKNTYGTGCFLLMNTGETRVDSRHGLLTTLACDRLGRTCYALEGSVFVAGAAIQWLRDELGLLDDSKSSEKHALSVEDNGGVYLVPAFSGLGSPHWRMDARGAIVGLTRGSNRNHIIRAALESIAYQTKEVLDVMEKEGGVTIGSLSVDGGASQNDFLMQFQADICQKPVVRSRNIETTAFGSACLAGLSVGLWSGEDLLKKQNAGSEFAPKMDRETADRYFKGYREAVKKLL